MAKISTYSKLLATRTKTVTLDAYGREITEFDIGLEKNEQEGVNNKDGIMIILREFYVRDNKTDPIFRKDESSVTLAFQLKTGNEVIDVNIGTFDGIRDGHYVHIKNPIVLPLTEVNDYLSITVNAIKENDLEKARKKITSILDFAGTLAGNVPAISAGLSPIINLTGALINMIIALSPEEALIRDSTTFLVSGDRYSHVKNIPALKTGLLYVVENGFELDENGNFNGSDPTRIVLEIVKPKSIGVKVKNS